MKRICFANAFGLSASLFAANYANNTYQKLAGEYSKAAQIALDAGEDASVDYSQKSAKAKLAQTEREGARAVCGGGFYGGNGGLRTGGKCLRR